ncbi:MAG: phosphoenolpyruvate-utilizing N-terminal domain-containing protein [Gemmiger sp.]|nr:phosphoenolpyruvate-utilizing N-terminal domain-containing protein [Gemmiger sp.]
MAIYKGLKTSPGIAVGPVAKIDRGKAGLHRIVCDPNQERALYEAAIILAKDELRHLQQKAQGPEADIFVFQIALLEDESFTNEIGDYIAAGAGSAVAVERAEQIFAARLDNVDDDYIRERSVDVRDACRRVIDILDGRPRQKLQLTKPSILAAELFYPSDILSVERSMILGLVSDADSPTSHAMIIARTMALPAVCQLGKGMADVAEGQLAVLDATGGVLTIDPGTEELAQAAHKTELLARRSRRKNPLDGKPCLTKDGTAFGLWANCVDPGDIANALSGGANGVGIVRSEVLLMRETSEDSQYAHYVACLQAAGDTSVTVRTFDVGDSAGMADQQELFGLDTRGVRLMDKHRDLFDEQICALLRAGAEGDLRVLLPMVSGAEDWRACMREVERCKELLRRRKVTFNPDVPFGCLIEIPAAALEAEEIVESGARFLMVGINDLVQYTCAATRTQSGRDKYYRADSAAVRRLVAMVQQVAAEKKVPLCIGGVAMEQPRMVEDYLRAGIYNFAVETAGLHAIKAHLLGVDITQPMAPAKK